MVVREAEHHIEARAPSPHTADNVPLRHFLFIHTSTLLYRAFQFSWVSSDMAVSSLLYSGRIELLNAPPPMWLYCYPCLTTHRHDQAGSFSPFVATAI
jgi:hypothetical protein